MIAFHHSNSFNIWMYRGISWRRTSQISFQYLWGFGNKCGLVLNMCNNQVAENVARKYGVSKSDLLNPEADDLAVRMALGETHIIAETKKALSSEGVNIEILEDLASGKVEKMKRSNHVLLIKNLPFSTSEADLMQMFGRFGRLERVILPPTKTMALDSRAKQWRVQAVAVSPDKFESRKPLPESWRGLRDDELSRECGIPDCVFVHISGFIGGNKSFDGALAMAKAALKL